MIISSSIPAIKLDVQIMEMGEKTEEFIPKSSPKPSFHYMIYYVVKGKCILHSNESKHLIESGQAFAIYGNTTNYFENVDENSLHYFWISFNGAESEKILSYIGFSKKNLVLEFIDQNEILNCLKELLNTYNINDKFLFLSNLYNVIYTFQTQNKESKQNVLNEDSAFFEALEYMQENIDKNLKIKDLTNHLYMGRSYFSKLFKEKFNVSPYKYYLSLKIKKAEFLLKSTRYSILEISNMLGFTNSFIFSKAFKQFYGISPSAYRRKK